MLKSILVRLLGFSLFVVAFAAPIRGQQPDRPNFLFILADDLGYMDVGFNNPNTFYETPNLDRLASGAMVFTDFYAACQVCSPTRASILTGKYPARLKATNFFSGRREGRFAPADFETQLSLDEVTLAEALKEAGYRTFFAGKWHLGPKGNWPTDQGFDLNRGGGENGLPRSYFSPYKNVDNLEPGPDGEYLTARLADEAVDFLESAAKEPSPSCSTFRSMPSTRPFRLRRTWWKNTAKRRGASACRRRTRRISTRAANDRSGRRTRARERSASARTTPPTRRWSRASTPRSAGCSTASRNWA